MNAMKFTGKALTLCFAAGIAAAVFSACGDKKTDEPASDPNAATQTQSAAAQMDDFDMKPATEAEVLSILYFLPDPVATVDGKDIPRKEIIDDLVEQGLPASLLESIGEERLRQAMNKQIEGMVKDRLMLKLAEEAGFKPSAEFVIKEMKEEFDESSEEEQEEIKEYLKERGMTLEEHMKKTSEDPEIQKLATLRKYTHTTFLDKAKKEVTDADIQKEYEAHIAELTRPEGITVAHILIQPDEDKDEAEADKEAKAKIDAIYDDLLKDPSKFSDLAVEKSDCPSGKAAEGKLPAFDKDGRMLDGSGAMIKEFVDAAYTIEKPGQITKPIKTTYGYHIIKLIEKNPEEVVPLEKIKDRITEHLVEEKAQEELDKTLDAAIEKYAKFKDFAPAKAAPAAE